MNKNDSIHMYGALDLSEKKKKKKTTIRFI